MKQTTNVPFNCYFLLKNSLSRTTKKNSLPKNLESNQIAAKMGSFLKMPPSDDAVETDDDCNKSKKRRCCTKATALL